ncbi:MAG: release factor glutamine methyltransferase, partial [Frankiaceae bacterium]|nr:release factor glutamine methyltransferase [Frankiaceae bacterium]
MTPQAVDVIVATLRRAGCVFAEEEAALLIKAAQDAADLDGMVTRRVTGLPLEQVIGYAEFHGLRILLEPGVFVPRHRTEFLVQQAIELTGPGDNVVDLCCGAGAIGAALLAAVEGITLFAADVDPTAVRCARRNLTTPAAHVYEGDLFDALPTSLVGAVDVLVANAPYVP